MRLTTLKPIKNGGQWRRFGFEFRVLGFREKDGNDRVSEREMKRPRKGPDFGERDGKGGSVRKHRRSALGQPRS